MVSLLSSTKVKVTRRKTKVLTEIAIISQLMRWSSTETRKSALLVGRKVIKCFTCVEKGCSYRACPQKTAKKDNSQAAMVLTENMHDQEQSCLCYAWGKVRDMDSFILFDPGSTHNFISTELAAKLSINEHEVGYEMDAEGAFVGKRVPITLLIGKLRILVQGYVDREDFFINISLCKDMLIGRTSLFLLHNIKMFCWECLCSIG